MSQFHQFLRPTLCGAKFEREVSRITSAEGIRRSATPGNFAVRRDQRTQVHSQARVLRYALGDSVPHTPWDFSPCCQSEVLVGGAEVVAPFCMGKEPPSSLMAPGSALRMRPRRAVSSAQSDGTIASASCGHPKPTQVHTGRRAPKPTQVHTGS